MKRFIVFLILFFFLVPGKVFAHPVDIASVVVSVNGQTISDGYRLPVTWSITVPEIVAITTLAKDHPDPNTSYDVGKYVLPVFNYLKDRMTVITDGSVCRWETDPNQLSLKQLDLTMVTFQGSVICKKAPAAITLTTTAFTKEFPSQVNIVLFTDGDHTLLQQDLSALETSVSYPQETPKNEAAVAAVSTSSWSITSQFEGKLKDLLTTSIPFALLIAFVVGFLHSMEAGHSKTILASLMLRRDATIRQGLTYSVVFTITHIADILLFGAIFLVINSFVNVYSWVTQLHKYAAIILLWLAVYMLVKALLEMKKVKDHEKEHMNGIAHDHGHDHNHTHTHEFSSKLSFRRQLWIGFLTGLAPCVMGWSIFFVIVSTHTVWAVFPVILTFGMGIYVSLILTTVLVFAGKNTILKRFSFLSTWSPIISSGFLVIFSLLLLLSK